MKYLKSFKIYESLNKDITLMFSDAVSLDIECELDQNGVVSDGGYNFGNQWALVKDDDMKKTFEPLKKIGVSVDYEGHYSKDGDDYGGEFSVNLEQFNKAIKEGKIKLELKNTDKYLVKIV